LRRRAVPLLLLIVSATLLIEPSLCLEGVRFRLTDTYFFENRGGEPIPFSEMDRAVSLFQNNSWQSVRILETNFPVERSVNDSDGNLYAVLAAPKSLSGRSNLTISVAYEITSVSNKGPELRRDSAQNLSKIPLGLVSRYCVPSGTWLVDDPRIRAKAGEIAGNETRVLMIVESLIRWIKGNIAYNTTELARYPNETLLERRGDCDDQAILFVTMCRILGIPTYLQIGCILKEELRADTSVWNNHVRINTEGVGWHGWAVVYVPPWGWLPVDFTYVTASSGLVPEIEHASLYEDYVILQQNVSKQDYVGEARDSRREVIDSSLYITFRERMVKLPTPTPSLLWIVAVPIVGGVFLILVFFLVRRRTLIRSESLYP